MPKRIKEYCKKTGQKVPETKGEVVRCIAESLAFKYRQTVEGMEDVTGNKYNVVNLPQTQQSVLLAQALLRLQVSVT